MVVCGLLMVWVGCTSPPPATTPANKPAVVQRETPTPTVPPAGPAGRNTAPTPSASDAPAALGAASQIPPENSPSLTAAPPRPTADAAQDRAAQLLAAIMKDDPALAAPFFFPREAFQQVKNIPDPDRYWQRLYARYETDIHTLHATLPNITFYKFVRLALSKRSEWMAVDSEGNKLPYWAARHNTLHYEADGRPAQLEVRVLITWGTEWYLMHLSEFRAKPAP